MSEPREAPPGVAEVEAMQEELRRFRESAALMGDVARDSAGFIRSQEEWDTLAAYARDLASQLAEVRRVGGEDGEDAFSWSECGCGGARLRYADGVRFGPSVVMSCSSCGTQIYPRERFASRLSTQSSLPNASAPEEDRCNSDGGFMGRCKLVKHHDGHHLADSDGREYAWKGDV